MWRNAFYYLDDFESDRVHLINSVRTFGIISTNSSIGTNSLSVGDGTWR